MPKRIYLDYAATTPVDREVLKAMLPYFGEKFGNAMSIHGFGQEALEAVDHSRAQLAKFFNCSLSEIIFTSGATESNNLTVKGMLRAYHSQKGKALAKPHIITTQFEHHCVLDACKSAEKEGLAEVTYLTVGPDGVVKAADVKKAIRPETILVSVMYVNNEIGTIQPITEIGKIIQAEKEKRQKESGHFILFHTDATQAVNYLDCNVKNLGVDLLSMSAHKIYGPKGVGMLYVKTGTPIKRTQDGGDQENKMRAGTHNVPGIVGLGKAVELLQKPKIKSKNKEILKLRDYLIKKVLREIPDTRLNGSLEKRAPNNTNFSFADAEGEGLLLSLDMEGIAASTGSACSSGALDPSHVLLAIGLKHEQAHGSLRFTLGKHTTKKELDTAVAKLKIIVKRLRSISGNILQDYFKDKQAASEDTCHH